MWGWRIGRFFGPLGNIVGPAVGAVAAVGLHYAGQQMVQQMDRADEDADRQLNSEEADRPCPTCLSEEEQEERQEELEEQAGVSQETKGRTRHGERNGGLDQANEDFDSLGLDPEGIRDIETSYGPGRVGEMENGNQVIVRPGSSDGRPTLQIRRPNGRQTEIRYNDVGM